MKIRELLKKEHISKKLVLANVVKKIFIRRPILLVSDRENSAGDNGEAFFRFIQDKKVHSFFEINRDCKDYEKMKKVGRVVSRESRFYNILTWFADAYVSSQLEFVAQRKKEVPYVFLQHGVTDKEISEYFNFHCKDWHDWFVVCSAKKEYELLCKDSYKIKKENIWLTGMPRFDRLYDQRKKKIMVSLTWRLNLSNYADGSNEDFLQSDYYKIHKEIFENKKLKKELEDKGYQLYVKLHPEMDKFNSELVCPKHVKKWEKSYREMFAETDLLITDYSSIGYDFALLKKPIIYCQLEEGESEENHVWKKGYFSYEKDGFGEVAHSVDEISNLICEYIENDCKMKEKYVKRVDKFFMYTDKSNCERVYNKILEIVK